MRKVVDENLDAMLEKAVVEPVVSPWSSLIVLVRKKDWTIRFCVDLRRVNGESRKDAYPLQISATAWACGLGHIGTASSTLLPGTGKSR
jgi:hypothetical protein